MLGSLRRACRHLPARAFATAAAEPAAPLALPKSALLAHLRAPRPRRRLVVLSLQALVDRLRPEISLVDNPPGANMLRSFGHLMNQYSAAYYGYMWAEVISADMFATRFKGDAECMSPEAGMAYRKQVLAPGGTGKLMDHLSKFLGGRPPEQEPFLRSRGIL